jgi:ATP-dependent DNA helicase RecQ
VQEARNISERELESVRKVLACMARMRRPFSTSLIAKVVTGSKDKTVRTFEFDQLSTWGILSGWSQARVERLLGAMEDAALIEGILTSRDIRGSARTWKNLTLTEHGRSVMRGDVTDVSLCIPKANHSTTTTFDPTESNDGVVDEDLLAHLRQTRYRLAQDDSVPAYVVASNRTLSAIAALRPTSVDALSSVHGMGHKRITRYGDELIDAVRGWTRC